MHKSLARMVASIAFIASTAGYSSEINHSRSISYSPAPAGGYILASSETNYSMFGTPIGAIRTKGSLAKYSLFGALIGGCTGGGIGASFGLFLDSIPPLGEGNPDIDKYYGTKKFGMAGLAIGAVVGVFVGMIAWSH